jgi:pimeloyl-ACP methyl ester carboxylesterase
MTAVQHLVSHRWRVPWEGFAVETDDGVRIEGTRVGAADPARPAVVLAHGLMGWRRKPRFAVFAELLSHWFTVYPFDLRGHGDSGGVCDYGGAEIHDVEAVVRRVRADGHGTVITMGTSLGAISAIRHGGLIGGVDAVVAISCLAWWDWRPQADQGVRRRLDAQILTPAGRRALLAVGIRLPSSWPSSDGMPEAPVEVVGKIAPAPVILVHGEDDPLFAPEHARALYEAANEPRHLLMGSRFGHAETGLAPGVARRIAGAIHQELELPWSA